MTLVLRPRGYLSRLNPISVTIPAGFHATRSNFVRDRSNSRRYPAPASWTACGVTQSVQTHVRSTRFAYAALPDQDGVAYFRLFRGCERHSFIFSFHGLAHVVDSECLPFASHVQRCGGTAARPPARRAGFCHQESQCSGQDSPEREDGFACYFAYHVHRCVSSIGSSV